MTSGPNGSGANGRRRGFGFPLRCATAGQDRPWHAEDGSITFTITITSTQIVVVVVVER